jgi:hypothetical protein
VNLPRVQVAIVLGGGHNDFRPRRKVAVRRSGLVVVGNAQIGVSTFCARFSLCVVSRAGRVRRSQTNYWERLAAPSGSRLFCVGGTRRLTRARTSPVGRSVVTR